LYDDMDSSHHSPILGYAFDGYPIYGAYGYADTNGTGGIKRMQSSFVLRNMSTRDTLPNGTVLNSGQYGPTLSTYPLGRYLEDFAFVPGSGDLDVHNGRFCVTPDYPNGTYAYFVTIDSAQNPIYPYVLGLNYYGQLSAANIGPGSGHAVITDSTTIYNPTATGIAQVNKPIQFMLYPNPASDYAYIYFDPSDDNNISGGLYNSEGQLLQAFTHMQPSISYTINLTSFPAGTYMLHLSSGTSVMDQKIVKVK
jgi:hypothetical protein